jgi:hypothetical protein
MGRMLKLRLIIFGTLPPRNCDPYGAAAAKPLGQEAGLDVDLDHGRRCSRPTSLKQKLHGAGIVP